MTIQRTINCSHCGAPVETRGDGGIVFCDYCGSYSNPDGTVYRPNPGKRSRQLKAAMNEALEENDIARWRRCMYESCMLDLKRNPAMYAGAPSDTVGLRDYVNKIVQQYELLNFDTEISKAFRQCQELINRLTIIKDKHVPACRDLLEAYRRYFSAYLYHPKYPFETRPGDAEQQALDVTRSAIRQYAALWGETTVNEVLVQLFGDREIGAGGIICGSCGLTLDAEGSSDRTCPKCGSVIYLNK